MREALTSFEAELAKLLRFLDASDAEDKLIAALLEQPEAERTDLEGTLKAIRANSTIKRRQTYVSSIIVLYGALERFVEETVTEYTQSLVEIYKEFQSLPEDLQERHTKLTIDYLVFLKDGRVRKTEDIDTVIETLHACLNGTAPFRLNARAFSLRSSNMNLKRIQEIFGNLDVKLPGKRILLAPYYKSFLEEIPDVSPKHMVDREVDATLEHVNDLVSIRNDIAHGVRNVETIENTELVRERMKKLHAFVTALNEVLDCVLMKCRIELGRLCPVNGKITVHGHHIVCFEWSKGCIARGDILVMQPADDSADLRYGVIETIQIDGADQTQVQGREGLKIGIRVPFKTKSNGEFYIWPRT